MAIVKRIKKQQYTLEDKHARYQTNKDAHKNNAAELAELEKLPNNQNPLRVTSVERQLINNEILLRESNKNAKQAIKKYFHRQKNVTTHPLEFQCECSNLACEKKISLTISQYEKLHRRGDRFIVSKSHETLAIEKIVQHSPHFSLVEKFSLQPENN